MATETGTRPMSLSDLTLSQKMDIALWLLEFPSLSVLIFLRRKVGYRTLKPLRLFIIAVVLCYLGNPHAQLFNIGERLIPIGVESPLAMFGTVVLIVGLVQRWFRWRDIRKGVLWHTHSRGVSYFEFLPIPLTYVYRFVDPIVAFFIGGFIGQLPWMSSLGTWIIFSAVCLFVLESYIRDKQLDHDLDILDNLVLSEVASKTVQHFSGGATAGSGTQSASLSETAGIPTGVASDIAAQIEARRRARAARGLADDDSELPPEASPEYPAEQADPSSSRAARATKSPPDNLAG